jgi:hypothetical protein
MNSFARYVCFTYNNPSPDEERDIKTMLSTKTDYAVFGRERGASGTLHLQGYFELPPKPRTRLSTMARWFPGRRAHLEKRRGKRHVAADYCKKGDQSHSEWELDGRDGLNFGANADVWEHGELPEDDKDQGKRTDIEKVRDEIVSGDIKNEFDLLMNVRSMPALRFGQIFLNNMPTPAIRSRPMVYWIHGPTGTGKSRSSAEIIERLVAERGWSFWRHNGSLQWFDGYNRQEIAWFDDYRFDGKGSSGFAYLLSLLDVYPMRVPIKGGFVQWSPKFIIFTGPKPYTESFTCLGGSEDLGQLGRRINKSFDFSSGADGRVELAMSIWTYMESGIDDSVGVQKWGEIIDDLPDEDSDEDPNFSDLEIIHEDEEEDEHGLGMDLSDVEDGSDVPSSHIFFDEEAAESKDE